MAATASAAYLAVHGGIPQVFMASGPDLPEPIPAEGQGMQYAEALLATPGDDMIMLVTAGR